MDPPENGPHTVVSRVPSRSNLYRVARSARERLGDGGDGSIALSRRGTYAVSNLSIEKVSPDRAQVRGEPASSEFRPRLA